MEDFWNVKEKNMSLIREMSTQKLYYFCVFEKWWYCFLLFGAWFLPHQCYKMKHVDLKRPTAKEKAKQNMTMLASVVLGPILSNIISKEVFYVIGKQYIVFHYLGVYLFLVSLNFIMFFLFKMPPNVDRKEFVDVRFVSIKKKSIKSLFYSILGVGLPTMIAFSIRDISIEGSIVFIGAVLVSCLTNLLFGVQKECVSSDDKVYFIGIREEDYDE